MQNKVARVLGKGAREIGLSKMRASTAGFFFTLSMLFSATFSQLEAAPVPCMQSALTFENAVSLSFSRSPQLRISGSEIQEKYGQRIQAGLFPNPIFAYSLDGLGGNTAFQNNEGMESSYTLSQLIELGGKRCLRSDVAKYEYFAAIAGYEITCVQLLNQLLKAFVEVAAAQELLRIAEEQKQISLQVLNAVAAKVEAGKASLIDQNKSKIAFAHSEITLTRARADLKNAKQNLSILWGCSCPNFDFVEYPFFEVQGPASFEGCCAKLKNNPELIQTQYIYLASRHNLNLEKSIRIPDVTVTVGYESEQCIRNGGLIVGVSLPLPVFDQNQGNIHTARSQITKVCDVYAQLQLLLQNRLAYAHRELFSAFQEVERFKSTVLKAAVESFEFAREGYQEGKFDYLDMLDSQRTLFEVQVSYIDALLNYHQKHADIEYLSTQVD